MADTKNTTIDDLLLSAKKARTGGVAVIINPDREPDIEATRRRLAAAHLRVQAHDDDTDPAIAERDRAELGRLMGEMGGYLDEGSMLELRFRAISADAYHRLLMDNPPIPGKGNSVYGPEFEPLLVAACSIEPTVISPETALEMWQSDQWSDMELERIAKTVVALNRVAPDLSLGKGLPATLSSARS